MTSSASRADARTLSSSSLATIGLLTGLAAAAVDVGARRADIAAVPAVAALHLLALAGVAATCALVVRLLERRRGGSTATPLLLGAAVVGFAAGLAGRLALGPTAPSTIPLLPLVAAGPLLLGAELARSWRAGDRPVRGWPHRVASGWYLVAGLATIAVAVGPSHWAQVRMADPALRALLGSTVVVALADTVALAVARRRRAALRSALIAGLAAAALVGAAGAGEPGWWPVAAGLAIVATVVLSTRTVRSRHDVDGLLFARAPSGARRGLAALRRAGRGGARLAVAVLRPVGRQARSTTRPPRPLTRADRWAGAAMALIAVGFVASGAAWALRVGYEPTGHAATYLARAYDVGTANHPLLGITTSLGNGDEASHPGPLLMDLLAPFVRIFGIRVGAVVGAGLLALTCWAVAVWAAWRAAGRTAAVVAWAAGAVVIEGAALGAVWEANNVSTGMLAMFAAVVACWAAASGAWRQWWWAVALGSLATQSYVAHALVVLPPIAWSGLVLLVTARRGAPDDRPATRTALRGGLLLGLVLWLQPLIDVVVNDGGNVRTILADQAQGARPPIGPAGAAQTVAWIFTLPPRWDELTRSFALAGNARDFLGGPWLVGAVLAAVVAVATVVTWRRTSASERQLRITVGAVILGAAVNATVLPADFVRSFQLAWLVLASIVAWFGVVLSVALAVERRAASSTEAPRWNLAVRAGGGVLACALVAGCALARPDRISDLKGQAFTIDAMVEPITDQVLDRLPTDDQILVLGLDSRLNGVANDTIVPNLIVRGVDVRVEVENGFHYGRRRQVREDWSGPMLWVVAGPAPVEPAGTRIARAEVPGWSQADFDRAAAAVGEAVRAAPSVELADFVVAGLPRYLAGWVEGDACALAQDLAAGRADARDLPDGVLLNIAADLGFTAPTLPPDLVEEATAAVGQEPIEVWYVERTTPARPVGDLLLRDDTTCPPQPVA